MGVYGIKATGREVGFVLGVLSYPRISSSVPRSTILAGLSLLLAVDRRLLRFPRISEYEPSRVLSSSITVRTIRVDKGSSSTNPKNNKLTGVRNHTNLARPFYTNEKESTQESHQDESPDMSPTYSQMINTISFNDEDFEINKDLLRKDFYSEANNKRKNWFFSTIPKDIRTLYQEELYMYLRQENKNIKFWIWFELFKQEEYPDYPCKYINNTYTRAKIWKTNDNIVIESTHPPEPKIEKDINGTIVRASLFKTKPEDKGNASAVDIRRIME
uniref:DUF7588 domain-containing protein n=1 Tax=Vitis vinifera TaxID=29760 RepID=A5CAI7_VITVI|nr:hypothetical protein VITISV_026447 [Vitis vinifera]